MTARSEPKTPLIGIEGEREEVLFRRRFLSGHPVQGGRRGFISEAQLTLTFDELHFRVKSRFVALCVVQ